MYIPLNPALRKYCRSKNLNANFMIMLKKEWLLLYKFIFCVEKMFVATSWQVQQCCYNTIYKIYARKVNNNFSAEMSNKLLLISYQPVCANTYTREYKFTHINTIFYYLCVFATSFVKMTSCSIWYFLFCCSIFVASLPKS